MGVVVIGVVVGDVVAVGVSGKYICFMWSNTGFINKLVVMGMVVGGVIVGGVAVVGGGAYPDVSAQYFSFILEFNGFQKIVW